LPHSDAIIAPGGAFVMLSYDSVGVEVARWLAERGIAAFVLKYRVRQTDPGQSPMAAVNAAGYKPELHRFQSGGHGFGMGKRFTTSDHWVDEFFWWMEANGLTRKPGDPERPNRAAFTNRGGGGRPN
jgi:hypothetical protein